MPNEENVIAEFKCIKLFHSPLVGLSVGLLVGGGVVGRSVGRFVGAGVPHRGLLPGSRVFSHTVASIHSYSYDVRAYTPGRYAQPYLWEGRKCRPIRQ